MKYVVVTLVVICLAMGLSWYNDKTSWNKERSGYILNDSLLQHKVLDIRDSANRQIVEYDIQAITKEQLLTSKSIEAEQLRKDLAKVNAKISTIHSSTIIHTTTRDTIMISVDHFIGRSDTGLISIPFEYEPDTFLQLQGISTFHNTDSGLLYKSTGIDITIANSTSITYFNRSKFLHLHQLELLITQDNPHTTTGKVQTYYIHPEKKWYQTWTCHAITGAILSGVIVHFVR